MNRQQGLIRTLGLIILGIAILAYFHADLKTIIESPPVKDKINTSVIFIENNLNYFLNVLNHSDTATTTATSTSTTQK